MQNAEQSQGKHAPETRPIVVWDWPTRLFHWVLVVLVTVSFVTAKVGGNAMQIHMWSGYTILTLLIFRLIWGFVGTRHVRFSSFLRGPATVWRYARTLMRKDYAGYLGHNPLGGWSIVAMLLSLLLQAVTGLFATDDIFIQGPLYPLVSDSTSSLLTIVHHLNQTVILALIALHVVAVLFYLVVKRDNLITPMLTGVKQRHAAVHAPVESPRTAAAIVVAVLSAVAVYLLVR